MNTLSWFLYFADIANGLKILFGVTGAISGVIVLLMLLIFGISEGDVAKSKHDEPNGFWKFWWRMVGFGFIALMVSVFVPSQKTLYAIAASEFSGKVLESERVQKGLDLGAQYVEKWLKKQVAE